MATLTNEQINLTYPGLIKTVDNLTIDATPRSLTDGIGLALPIEVSTSTINFTAGVDFSAATITGLPSSPTGLEPGTGVSSMKSAAFLTTTPAVASGQESVAIGSGATASNSFTTAIGRFALASFSGATAYGNYSKAKNLNAISIGYDNNVTGSNGVSIGANGSSVGANSVSIGNYSGYLTGAQEGSVSIGGDSGFSNGIRSVQVGFGATAKALSSTSIGNDARVDDNTHAGAVCIGLSSRSGAAGTVSLGRTVTAVNWIDSTTVNQLALKNYVALNYADDAAAATGGVPLGGIYHNAGALKIRIV